MITFQDIQKLAPLLKINVFMREAGINPATYRQRVHRNSTMLTVEEALRLEKVLKGYGLQLISKSSN